jgi:sugar lactone lactonase YvrE
MTAGSYGTMHIRLASAYLLAVGGLGVTAPHRLAVVDQGLAQPEALSYAAAVDAYFVSNVNGDIGAKDNNGFITRIRGDGTVDSLHFIQGGRNGVTLNGPMGSRVKGDTLWVLDVDVLRGFDIRTGAPLAAIDFGRFQPGFLNDVAIGPDNDFYVTDTKASRIFHVGRDRTITVAVSGPALAMPDGIDWEPAHKALLLAPFGGNAVQRWVPGAAQPTDVAPGKSKFDGIEVETDGTVFITSWNDSSVSVLKGSTLEPRVTGLSFPPADVSYDSHRNRVGVVSLTANRFELWSL